MIFQPSPRLPNGITLRLQVRMEHHAVGKELVVGLQVLAQAQHRVQGLELEVGFGSAEPLPSTVHALAIKDLVGRSKEPHRQKLVEEL